MNTLNTMNTSQTEYRSYLLRLWRLGETSSWHVMIEQIGSQERHTFANLKSLIDFLQAEQSGSAIEAQSSEDDEMRR
jgi:hypothetical protein